MTLLWQKDNVPVKSLTSRLLLDTGTITPLLKRLISLGYVAKERSDKDEREVLIRLTKKGHELERKAENVPADMFCKLKVSMARFAEIRNGVREISQNLLSESLD